MHYFIHPSQNTSIGHLVPSRHQGDSLFASPKERLLSVPLLSGPCLRALSRDLSLFPPLLLGAMGAITAYTNTRQGHCSPLGDLYLQFQSK